MKDNLVLILNDLKFYKHELVYQKFLNLFETLLQSNHDKMDTCEITDFPNYQGKNQQLKYLLNQLS